MTDTNTPSETCAQELEKWLEESKPAETAVKFVNTIVSNMLEFTSPDTGEGIPDFKEHKIRLQIEDPDDDSITILKNLVHMLRNRDTFRNADLEKQTQNTLIQLRQGLVEARDAIGLGKDPHTILEKYRKYKEPPEQRFVPIMCLFAAPASVLILPPSTFCVQQYTESIRGI